NVEPASAKIFQCRNRFRGRDYTLRESDSTGSGDSAHCDSTSPQAAAQYDRNQIGGFRQSAPESSSQVFSHNLAGRNLCFQTMESLVQTHLCAGHEYQIGQHSLGPKQILRFVHVIVQELLVTKIEPKIFLRIRRINFSVEIFCKLNE